MREKTVRLTRAEEDIMAYIWDLEKCTVSDILEKMGKPKPPHSTISSIVRILEKKGFVGHKAYGRTYEYFPLIRRSSYSRETLAQLVKRYYQGSFENMISSLVKNEELDLDAIREILVELEKMDD